MTAGVPGRNDRKDYENRVRLFVEAVVAHPDKHLYEAGYAAGYKPGASVQRFLDRMAKDEKVQAEIERRRAEVVAEIQDETGVSLAAHLNALLDLREAARADGKWSDAIKAEELRGRASGRYVERKETGKPGEFTEDAATLEKRCKERAVRLGLAKVVPTGTGKQSLQ